MRAAIGKATRDAPALLRDFLSGAALATSAFAVAAAAAQDRRDTAQFEIRVSPVLLTRKFPGPGYATLATRLTVANEKGAAYLPVLIPNVISKLTAVLGGRWSDESPTTTLTLRHFLSDMNADKILRAMAKSVPGLIDERLICVKADTSHLTLEQLSDWIERIRDCGMDDAFVVSYHYELLTEVARQRQAHAKAKLPELLRLAAEAISSRPIPKPEEVHYLGRKALYLDFAAFKGYDASTQATVDKFIRKSHFSRANDFANYRYSAKKVVKKLPKHPCEQSDSDLACSCL